MALVEGESLAISVWTVLCYLPLGPWSILLITINNHSQKDLAVGCGPIPRWVKQLT